MYRRGDAVVKCAEYNTHFISWLQLIYEGRIAAIAGFDWRSVVENSRIRYQQLEKQSVLKPKEPANVKSILNTCIKEYIQGLETKIKKQTNQIDDLEAKMDKKLDEFKKDILNAFSQSLKSADDVHQKIIILPLSCNIPKNYTFFKNTL